MLFIKYIAHGVNLYAYSKFGYAIRPYGVGRLRPHIMNNNFYYHVKSILSLDTKHTAQSPLF